MMKVQCAIRAAVRTAGSPGVLLGIGYVCLTLLVWRSVAQRPVELGSIPADIERSLPADVGSRPALAFVFNPRDCPECLRLGYHWNVVHEQGQAAVLGIAMNGAEEPVAAERLRGELGFRFPVIPRSEPGVSRSLLALGQDTTPVTILTDRRRRPILVVPPLRDGIDQHVQAEIVTNQIQRLLDREGRYSR